MVSKGLTFGCISSSGLLAAARLQCICMPNIAPLWVDRAGIADQVAPRRGHFLDLSRPSPSFIPDSRRAWIRLAVAVLIGSLGSVGMWSVVVALPVVQAEFGVARGTASLAFTLVMLGFGSGGVLTGKITDRYGIVAAIGVGIGILGLGYVGAGLSSSIWQFILVHFADRARFVGDLRAADGGSLALVQPLPRPRGRDRRQRQLHRRHDLAAAGQLGHAVGRLAHHPYRASASSPWSR